MCARFLYNIYCNDVTALTNFPVLYHVYRNALIHTHTVLIINTTTHCTVPELCGFNLFIFLSSFKIIILSVFSSVDVWISFISFSPTVIKSPSASIWDSKLFTLLQNSVWCKITERGSEFPWENRSEARALLTSKPLPRSARATGGDVWCAWE